MSTPVVRVLELLRKGEIELLGLLPGASNYTFAAAVADAELNALAVYKPRDGETPLWDFPEGTLFAREVAAYEMSEALGWNLVPPTIVRDGPHGIGSLQLFIDADYGQQYFTLMPARADAFRLVAAFDILINNGDRKSGHCLLEQETNDIWFVDHGVCFHAEEKLRTVIWDFAGEAVASSVLTDLRSVDAALADEASPIRATLKHLLSPQEIDAMRARFAAFIASGIYPLPDETRRSYPWPPI